MIETGYIVNFPKIAKLVVQEGLAEHMSRQRVYWLRHNDPDFPEHLGKMGRMEVFDWLEVRRYFATHDRSHRRKGWRKNANGRTPSK